MMSGWSKGGTTVSPPSAASTSARSFRCSDVVPAKITSAPNRRALSTLTFGAVVGITTVARAPSRDAAMASAWP
jgi:hypothetical protein